MVHYVKLYEISVLRLRSHLIPEGFSCRLETRNWYTVNSSSTELEQVVYKHQTSCRSGWQRGFGELNPSPYSWIFSSISVGPSPLSYLFTSATSRIPVHTAPKWGTEPIRYVTLHVRDQQAQLRSLTVQKQRQKSVSDPGVGPGAPPTLFLDQTEVQRAEKIFSGDWGPPPYLRVWMTTPPPYFKVWIWKSPFFRVNRGPTRYGFSAAANANRYSVNVSLIKLPLHCIYTEIILLFFHQFLVWYAEVFSHL